MEAIKTLLAQLRETDRDAYVEFMANFARELGYTDMVDVMDDVMAAATNPHGLLH
jgi:hypothetical protein